MTAWYDRSKPSIFGSVTDSAGAPIPGAVVTATSTEYPYSAAAPGTVTATANAAGAYQILASNPNLWVVCSDGPTHNYVLGCFGVDGTTTPGDVVGVPSYARTGPVNLTLHK